MSVYSSATEVAQELSARLATILTSNGFNTNMGQRVYRGRVAVSDDDVPCVSLIEGDEDVRENPSRLNATAHITQQYALAGYAPCDPLQPNDAAHEIIKDMKRAIFQDKDSSLTRKVRRVAYKGRNIGPRADSVPIVQAVIYIEVEYVEDLSAP